MIDEQAKKFILELVVTHKDAPHLSKIAHKSFERFPKLREHLKLKRSKFSQFVKEITEVTVRSLSFETEPRVYITAEKRKEIMQNLEKEMEENITAALLRMKKEVEPKKEPEDTKDMKKTEDSQPAFKQQIRSIESLFRCKNHREVATMQSVLEKPKETEMPSPESSPVLYGRKKKTGFATSLSDPNEIEIDFDLNADVSEKPEENVEWIRDDFFNVSNDSSPPKVASFVPKLEKETPKAKFAPTTTLSPPKEDNVQWVRDDFFNVNEEPAKRPGESERKEIQSVTMNSGLKEANVEWIQDDFFNVNEEPVKKRRREFEANTAKLEPSPKRICRPTSVQTNQYASFPPQNVNQYSSFPPKNMNQYASFPPKNLNQYASFPPPSADDKSKDPGQQLMDILGLPTEDKMLNEVPFQESEMNDCESGLQFDFTGPKILSRANLGDSIIRHMHFNSHGSDLLTLDSDDCVKMWETDDALALKTTIKMKQHIYDIAWVPSSDQKKFVCVGADIPVQLWDLHSETRIQNYQSQNHVGEYKTGISCCCPFDGDVVAAGFKKRIHVYKIEHPQEAYRVETVNKARQGQKSFLSCMEFLPETNQVYAAGSYDGRVQLFDMRHVYAIHLFRCQASGVTCVKGSPCGRYLFTGARRNDEIYVWDRRKLPGNDRGGSGANIRVHRDNKFVVTKFQRHNPSNQLLAFDIDVDGKWLVSPSFSGAAEVYSLEAYFGKVTKPSYSLEHDCKAVSGLSIGKHLNILATSTGTRTYGMEESANELLLWSV